jgi:hypothetical protein
MQLCVANPYLAVCLTLTTGWEKMQLQVGLPLALVHVLAGDGSLCSRNDAI